jgi:hypothetical protein
MLTIVPVVRSEHLPELFGELILLPCGVRVVLASLMISNAKSHSAAIAKLKGFDRVRRILCNFLVQYSYGTIQITCHVILRWVEDSLAQQIVIFELGSLRNPSSWRSTSRGGRQDQDRSTGKVYLEKNNRALWNSCEPVNNFSKIFGG